MNTAGTRSSAMCCDGSGSGSAETQERSGWTRLEVAYGQNKSIQAKCTWCGGCARRLLGEHQRGRRYDRAAAERIPVGFDQYPRYRGQKRNERKLARWESDH